MEPTMTVLREVSQQLWPAVSQTVAVLKLDPDGQDAAAAKLALQYARTIDEAPPGKAYAAAIRWLGPELLKVLAELGATPAARAAMKKTKPADAKPNGLAKLRDARSA
jgi:hypothetical protein